MSTTNKYVNEHGMPKPFTAAERRRLAREDADAAIRPARESTSGGAAPEPRAQSLQCYHCFMCHLKKNGRFTRGKTWSGSGWSQHKQTPVWACWDCLPFGDGRGEDEPKP